MKRYCKNLSGLANETINLEHWITYLVGEKNPTSKNIYFQKATDPGDKIHLKPRRLTTP